MRLAMNGLDGTVNLGYLPFVSRHMSAMIEIVRIEIIRKRNRQIIILLEGDEREYVFTEDISRLEGFLDDGFCTCISNCIVNLRLIKVMNNDDHKVEFFDGRVMHLGRDSFIKLKQKYNAYLRGILSPEYRDQTAGIPKKR